MGTEDWLFISLADWRKRQEDAFGVYMLLESICFWRKVGCWLDALRPGFATLLVRDPDAELSPLFILSQKEGGLSGPLG